MGNVPVASFDPLFFLHHWLVFRVFIPFLLLFFLLLVFHGAQCKSLTKISFKQHRSSFRDLASSEPGKVA